ncbi:MAG: U32 family peptidase [Eubacteriales bacterium]|nr:U32 family peptidase [Eubacteriales bacterium]
MNNKTTRVKPEILAPAGSMEALKAAVYAGADAIYLGGNRFGARAYADNFEGDALIQAIQYAHIYGVKVYLTINTLFRDAEIDELYDYLLEAYKIGLDAVIVQDLGVMKFVHDHFPDLAIHASTQMTITTPYAYTLLKDYGVTRIVPARELSIDEIAALKTNKDFIPETEVFVQGALCYCYSGQCLMSSFLGGRSGNRGRCAQTCRLPYQIFDEQGHPIHKAHVLSPKDLCGLEHIPDLIHAGVDSFKIEGRMKKPEYVAVCVDAYRTCVDAYFDGKLTPDLINQKKQEMAEVFNRGGFTKGYYQIQNGPDMMTMETPGNIGVVIGSIQKIQKNKIWITLEETVSPGDLFMIRGTQHEINLTCNTTGMKKDTIILNASHTNEIKIGDKVSRMQNAQLMKRIQPYIEDEPSIKIAGHLQLLYGQRARFVLSANIKNIQYEITCMGEQVEKAKSNPLTHDIVEAKIKATGGTRYEFSALNIEISDDIFYSMKALKYLRREAISMLETSIIHSYHKHNNIKIEDTFIENKSFIGSLPETMIVVSNINQLEIAKQYASDSSVVIDSQYFSYDDLTDFLKDCTIQPFIMLPSILRKQNLDKIKDIIQICNEKKSIIPGIIVRNIDELALLVKLPYTGVIIADYSLYCMNRYAYQSLKSFVKDMIITIPVELNERQITQLIPNTAHCSFIVYGHQQLMVSAQCIQNNLLMCNKANSKFELKDRYQKSFMIQAICQYCYNIIYNGIPTVLFDLELPKLLQSVPKRLHFVNESTEQMQKILECYYQKKSLDCEITRGHYKRGVE